MTNEELMQYLRTWPKDTQIKTVCPHDGKLEDLHIPFGTDGNIVLRREDKSYKFGPEVFVAIACSS